MPLWKRSEEGDTGLGENDGCMWLVVRGGLNSRFMPGLFERSAYEEEEEEGVERLGMGDEECFEGGGETYEMFLHHHRWEEA